MLNTTHVLQALIFLILLLVTIMLVFLFTLSFLLSFESFFWTLLIPLTIPYQPKLLPLLSWLVLWVWFIHRLLPYLYVYIFFSIIFYLITVLPLEFKYVHLVMQARNLRVIYYFVCINTTVNSSIILPVLSHKYLSDLPNPFTNASSGSSLFLE